MRSNWLYLAIRSVRESEPVLICPAFVATAISAIVESSVSLPRVRDFHGVPTKSFDGRGNYTLGVKEQLIFPEINFDDFLEYGKLVFNTLIFLERYLYLNIIKPLRKRININFLKKYSTQSLYKYLSLEYE